MASNYDDVLSQLRSGGLIVDRLETGKVQRCKVEGSHEKRGWYLLTEWRKDNGDDLLVGSYGVWRGSSNNAQRIVLNGVSLTAEQKAAFKRRLTEDSKRARAQRDQEGYRAAKRAESAWRDCLPDGQSSYLKRKLIDENYGAKYSPKGALVIPMADHSGRCHGLQFILSKDTHASRIEKTGRDKEYWPKGLQKRGHFHLIGGKPERILLIAEGFATAASLHMATNMSVAVAFDANNLQPVAESFKKRYPYLNILICGDDDRWTKDQNGNPWNPGVECASAAALSVTGSWIVPQFSDDVLRDQLFADKGEKNSDFNDLHKLDGLDAISNQINAKLEELQWFRRQHESNYALPEDGQAGELKPIDSYDELLERFALIYGNNGSVFDFQERKVMQLSDMRDACLSRELHRRWQESMLRKIVRPDEVGFDPTETDESIKCNLWGGWPTTPKSGSCEVLLGLLEYLTMNAEDPDSKDRAIYEWVLKWLAYPIQHPGAKMKTALIFHGPQGAGKNMFFEAYKMIYGKYGLLVDQTALEDKYNNLFSAKLFLIGDEVVAHNELYHTKNMLKGFITGDTIRINPKNVAAHTERNHLNVVFLSNQIQPLAIDEDDRRYAVIWTPSKFPPKFYTDVKEEINEGGIEALHHYLLHLPLGDFKPHTLPPMTESKRELIDLGMDSTERFWSSYSSELIDGIKPLPARSEDIFELYRIWCGRVGITKFAPMHVLTGKLGKRPDVKKDRGRFFAGAVEKQAAFIYPKGQFEPPDGKTQLEWLSQCVVDFKESLLAYKNDRLVNM